MQNQPADNSNSAKQNSTKKLVKILVAVGIGVPVLVELMTLFNLMNVNFFKDEPETPVRNQGIVEEQAYTRGDTLLSATGTPVVIDHLMIKVNANSWVLEMAFSQPEAQTEFAEIVVDSLKLENGTVLEEGPNQIWKRSESDIPQLQIAWNLPNGGRPEIIYLSDKQTETDEVRPHAQHEISLGSIPIRYDAEVD